MRYYKKSWTNLYTTKNQSSTTMNDRPCISLGSVPEKLVFEQRSGRESAVSYKWTGWVWEITSRSSRLHENYRSFSRNLEEYTQFNKGTQRMSTCNRLDLQTLVSPPVKPKNLPNHWFLSIVIWVKILVILKPAGYILTSSAFALYIWGIFFHRFL